ncbi:uroporphyrinogen-III synthase [compost metagenome]
METVRILSTKKLLPNQKQYLLNAGLSVLEADFIGIEYTTFNLNTTSQNLLFTSQNAVKSFLENEESNKYKSQPVFCVGSKTKEAIETAGFKVIACTDYASDLAGIITKDHSNESFAFFAGNLRKNTLPDAFAKAGIVFDEIRAYKTLLTPHKINSGIDGVLFYSPSGIESYLKENTITIETCFCIGTTTAEALKGITKNIVIANKQTVENVIIQCINYYKESI